MKKIASLCLAAIILVSTLVLTPITASAATGTITISGSTSVEP